MIDPVELGSMSKEALVEAYQKLGFEEEEVAAGKQALRQEILARLRDDAEVWGKFSISRVRRPNYAKVSLETARLFGAVKESVDTSVLRKVHAGGVAIEGVTESVYPLVKSLEDAS